MPSTVDFFLIGAQKAGTTALAHTLQGHPDIEMASVKEPHFFDDETLDWTTPDYQRLHTHFDWSNPDSLRGEATPIYSYWPPSLPRLHQYNPDAKLIFALRHPVLRAHSHWRMEVTRNLETLPFDDAISEPARQRVRHAPLGAHRVFSYVERGHYAEQLERALTLFPPTQIHFLRTDALWSTPDTVLDHLETFLEIGHAPDLATRDYIVSVRAAPLDAISHSTKARLTDHYADDIRQTAALTGLALDDWLDENYREPMQAP